MFTIDQLKAAHSKVKSGADFPAYIQEINKLGVKEYSTYVSDGHTEYQGENNYRIKTDPRYEARDVAASSDTGKLTHSLKIHQQGQTDYPTFLQNAAAAGVQKWVVNITNMTCTYYDKAGDKILIESIPTY